MSLRQVNIAHQHPTVEEKRVANVVSSTDERISPSKAHLTYRPDIDGLRAIAVTLVVGYHAFPEAIPGGFVGVDIFFVISGYLITGIIFQQLREDRFSILAFYARRVRRIFPALILVTLITFAIGWFALSVKEFKSLGASMVGSAAFVQNFILLGEVGYFDVEAVRKPLLHIWSLGIEEQYYIFWPAILIIAKRAKLNALTLVLALAGGSYLFGIFIIKENVDLAFYLPFSRFWELLAGSAIAIATSLLEKNWVIERLLRSGDPILQWLVYTSDAPVRRNLTEQIGALAAILLIGFVAIRYFPHMQYPGRHALPPVVAASVLILCKSSWLNRFVLASPPVVFIGLISYPLYLWHFPLMAYARILSGEEVSWKIMVAIVLASILLAWLTYRFVERPFRFGGARRYAVAILVTGMSAVGGLGSLAFFTNGLPTRIPDQLRQFMLTGEETSRYWRRGSCLLLPEQDYSAFGQECAGRGGHPLLFLWGDSYAAAQYPGLESLRAASGYDVAEYTSSACAPLMGYVNPGRPFCKGNNDFVLQRVELLRPDVVILHSTWQVSPADINQGLEQTVARLRSLSIRKIVLLGPVPTWKGAGLSANVIDYYYEHGLRLMPARTSYRLNEDNSEEQLRGVAERLGIEYISPRQVMCNLDGCLARVGPEGADLTAFDTGHMTVAGSSFLARAILPDLLRGVK